MVDCGDKVFVVAREEGRGSLSGATISHTRPGRGVNRSKSAMTPQPTSESIAVTSATLVAVISSGLDPSKVGARR